MKKLICILVMSMTLLSSTNAIIRRGIYEVTSWSSTIGAASADGVVEDDALSVVLYGNSIKISAKGYPVNIFTGERWIAIEGGYALKCIDQKTNTSLVVGLKTIENLPDSYVLTVLYDEDIIDTFGISLKQEIRE